MLDLLKESEEKGNAPEGAGGGRRGELQAAESIDIDGETFFQSAAILSESASSGNTG